MFSKSLATDKSGLSRSILVIVIVLLVVSSSAAGFFLLNDNGSKTITQGAKFRADYTGMFTDGKVFDTTMYDIAIDNSTYPKSLTFTWKGNESKWVPVNFTQGVNLIKGFSSGVLGMKEGETRTFTVSPQDGYPIISSNLANITINQTVPFEQWLSGSEYKLRYGSNAEYNAYMVDPVFGWWIQVIQLNSTTQDVKIRNLATNGTEYTAYASPSGDASVGWKLKVLSVDPTTGSNGEIKVQNLVNESDSRQLKGYDGATKKTFIVQSVDIEANKMVIYFGKEVDGQTMVFTVHVWSIG